MNWAKGGTYLHLGWRYLCQVVQLTTAEHPVCRDIIAADSTGSRRFLVAQLAHADCVERVVVNRRSIEAAVVINVSAARIADRIADGLSVEIGSTRKGNISVGSVDDRIGARTAAHTDIV